MKCISRHEATGIYTAPGFIDLQVNGFAGADYNSPATPHDEIARSLSVMHSTGVTRCFPTVITASPENMRGAVANIAAAAASMPSIEAIHVEGPYISPEDGPRGAHPRRWVRPPDLDEFHALQNAARGLIRLVTLAPEWPGAPSYIAQLTAEGVAVSIGHTRASREQIKDAVRAGATLSTHLGNGADSVLPRHPNYIWDQLAEDRLSASFIADGHHLPAAFLKSAIRAKGIERSILVTDAAMPALAPPGPYMLGEVEVELLTDGRVVLRNDLRGGTRLAGSSLRMDHAVSNVMRLAGVSLDEAVTMAAVNPARLGRVAETRNDSVRFRVDDGHLRVLETYVSGERVFIAPEV